MELVSIDADGPTDRCSVCDVVHFISPDNRDAKIPRLPWNSGRTYWRRLAHRILSIRKGSTREEQEW